MEFIKGLTLCEEYYRIFGAPMIKEKFSDYEDRIAVGLVGAGSECYGFDDIFSTDHDFGPSFCMWLTNSDYEEIGEALAASYHRLPDTFKGFKRIISTHGGGRVGVFRIGDFYRKYTGREDPDFAEEEWFRIPEHFLAEVTNGKVFRDDLGEFSGIRNRLLKYYPEDVRIKKIAASAARMAQSGQYNYSRCMKRSEVVAARLALDEFIKNAIAMVYLVNRSYKPYDKWSFRGTDNLVYLSEAREMLQELASLEINRDAWKDEQEKILPYQLNTKDRCAILIEEISSLVVKELLRQGLTDHSDSFLQNHTDSIMSKIANDRIRAMHVMIG